jgi:hypothetical protein
MPSVDGHLGLTLVQLADVGVGLSSDICESESGSSVREADVPRY